MAVRVAALYDVHGNLPALEAVLADVPRDADLIVGGRDLVWGPWPSECLALAESFGDRARFVRGNTESLVLDDSGEHAWARERLDRGQLHRIRAWPRTIVLDVDGLGRALFCHASPRSEDESLVPESHPDRWAAALAEVAERTVVCGHTHLQFDRRLGGRRVVNPGSVGAPTARPAAWWAMLGPDVVLRATSYDTAGMIGAAASIIPDVRRFAWWLRETPSYEERVASLEGVP
jgi:diadenosine tetraphosphatase ApaH/serine/threonine PP2A family protein phosphatase